MKFHQSIIKYITLFMAISFLGISQNADAQYIRTKHASMTKNYAKQCAEELMEQVCPNTGNNSYATINKWYYDEYTGEYEIHLYAYWTGRVCGLCSKRKFNIDGILTVKSNGHSTFKKTYQNDAVDDVEDSKYLWGGAIITIGVLSAMNNN